MSKTFMTKRKAFTAILAVVMAVCIIFGGTFAWQSINQTALNEASDVINPGGRLHDDFNGTNKDVYVENFAKDPIFARVRLDEYFEIVMNKGAVGAEKTEVITKYENEYGDLVDAVKGDTDTYVTHLFGETNATDEYWNWTTGGSTIYMPTFNMNKDSLAADINGTYNGLDGIVTDEATDDRYSNYETYEDQQVVPGTEIYDADTNNIEDENVKEVEATHTAKPTLDATLISMEQWIAEGMNPGEYWVYDTDGWVYWAQAIQPDTATGLLLDGIELTQVMDDSWYYAINVVAQFVTADDLGRGSGTGFYDLDKGTAPTPEALELLEKIGVDTTAEVSDLDELLKALEEGSDVLLKGEITSDSENGQIQNAENNYNLLWHNGGKMTAGTLNLSGAKYGLFINNENNWPVDGDGANAATLSDTTVNSGNNVAVYTQAIDAPIVLKNVKINAAKVGLYSEYTNLDDSALGTVTLENCTIISQNQSDKFWQNSAVSVAKCTPANGAGHVIINSGYYEGDYAVYVYSSGGTIEINGGYFDGALKADAGTITITGGTFTADPTEFVDLSTYEVVTNEDGTYTVKEIGGGESDTTYTELVLSEEQTKVVTIPFNTPIKLVIDGADSVEIQGINYATSYEVDGDGNLVESDLTGVLIKDTDYSYDSENSILTITNPDLIGYLLMPVSGRNAAVMIVGESNSNEASNITTDDGTLDSLTDTVALQLNNYDGTVTWSASSEDVVVTDGENGTATVTFKTFEAPSAPSAYEYTITAADAEGATIATCIVKYAPTTYTAKQVAHANPDIVSEITDSVSLSRNRYPGEFYIEETSQVNWTVASEDSNTTYTGNGNINYDSFEAGTYTATAECTCPDGTTKTVSFTVTVAGGGISI